MILAAHDVGDAKVDVVDHARQEIEPAAVLAPHDGVGEQLRVEALRAPNEVGPFDRPVVIEPEAPVSRAPLGRRFAGLLALVDRRQPAPEQHLAAKLELLGRLVAGVDAAGLAQPLELAFVQVESLRLTHDPLGPQAEPVEIVADGLVEPGGRALPVGVVDAQDEAAAVLPGEEIIVQRRADVAHVQPSGR